MKSLILLVFSILLLSQIHAQSTHFAIPISIQDSADRTDTIQFGIHPLATPCIDSSLGEIENAPDGQCNWFTPLCFRFEDVNLNGCLGLGVRLDLRGYREALQKDTFRIACWAQYPITLRWPANISSYFDSARMRDGFRGYFFDVDMTMIDSLRISNRGLHDFFIITTGPKITTDVKYEENQPPGNFTLPQNYPNPFNSSTTITYRLRERSHVVIKIIDLLGREIITLVNQREEAGEQLVRFEADGLGSGVYLLTMSVNGSREVRKLLVQK